MATVYITAYSRGVIIATLPTTICISVVPKDANDDDDDQSGMMHLKIDAECGKFDALGTTLSKDGSRVLGDFVRAMPNSEQMSEFITAIIAHYSEIPSTRVDFLMDVVEMNLTVRVNSIGAIPMIRIAPTYIEGQVIRICETICAVHHCTTARLTYAAAKDTLDRMEADQQHALARLAPQPPSPK